MHAAEPDELRVFLAFIRDEVIYGFHVSRLHGNGMHDEVGDGGIRSAFEKMVYRTTACFGDGVEIGYALPCLLGDLFRVDVCVSVNECHGVPSVRVRLCIAIIVQSKNRLRLLPWCFGVRRMEIIDMKEI